MAVLLVVVCALAAVLVGARVGGRVAVLAAARDLPAGHVMAELDLRVVNVAADAEAGLLPASQKSRVVGTTTAVPLVAGALLVGGVLGKPRWPAPGMALAAVALKPGRYPPGLSSGARVGVVIAPPPDAASGGSASDPGGVSDPDAEPRRVPGTVTAVTTAGDGSGTVVALLLAEDDAELVAAAPADRLALVQLGSE